jgi:hypothetical protein
MINCCRHLAGGVAQQALEERLAAARRAHLRIDEAVDAVDVGIRGEFAQVHARPLGGVRCGR